MAELAFAGAIAILFALSMGPFLGEAALKFQAVRFILDVATQFRAGLGLWLLAAAMVRSGTTPSWLAIGLGAGATQGIVLAQWICHLSPGAEPGLTRGISLARLGAALLNRERRLTTVAFNVSLLSLLHVLGGAEILRVFAAVPGPANPSSYVILGLGLLPWVVLGSTEARGRLESAFR